LRGLQDLGEDISSKYIPPKVASGLMIPAGRWFKVRYERFEQEGQRLQCGAIASSRRGAATRMLVSMWEVFYG
jgi:hypothetical protein